ncbi:MAG: hypothetical protein GY894_08745 [Planctomycetes bacterium]|nr:hypothetical protein [Planctomycetota bacterium]
MNRLLRKYNRILLAVFGVGLMIVFLMPQLPDLVAQVGGRGSQIATMGKDGTPVTREDWRLVTQQIQVLQRLEGFLSPLPIIGSIGDDPERYYLLIHEAAQAGMIGGDASAAIDPDGILQLAQQTGLPPASIRQTLINYSGIRRYLSMVATAGRVSDRRLRLGARRMLDGVDAKYAVVPATTDGAATPTETDMQAHFEKWADVNPGEGDHGFGYRLPDRASIEWLEIPTKSVEAAVQAGIDAEDLELRKYWRLNEARFEDVDASAGVPDDVRNAFVVEQVAKQMPTIARAAGDALRTPRRGFTTTENFIVLPDDWATKQLSMESLRTKLADRFQLPLDGEDAVPATGRTDDIVDMTEIGKLPRIASSGTDRYGAASTGSRTRQLSNLVAKAKEFGGTGEVPVQVGVAGPVLEDPQGNLWIFRITQADAARPPANVDEVRGQITEDLQRLAQWEVLRSELDAITEQAHSQGLAATATARGTDVLGPRAFQRNLHPSVPRPPTVPGLGTDQGVIDALVDHSIKLGTEPIKGTDASERTLVLPSEQNMAVVIAEIQRRTPLSEDQYDRFLEQGAILSRILTDEFGGQSSSTLSTAFSAEALCGRHDFQRSGEDKDETSDSPAVASPEDAAASSDTAAATQ